MRFSEYFAFLPEHLKRQPDITFQNFLNEIPSDICLLDCVARWGVDSYQYFLMHKIPLFLVRIDNDNAEEGLRRVFRIFAQFDYEYGGQLGMIFRNRGMDGEGPVIDDLYLLRDANFEIEPAQSYYVSGVRWTFVKPLNDILQSAFDSSTVSPLVHFLEDCSISGAEPAEETHLPDYTSMYGCST